MGLDMYLNKKHYVRHDENLQITFNGIKSERVKEVTEEICYWRKANQIHKWFVDNVQDGVDDCGTYELDKATLKRLLDTVNAVLESKDNDLALNLLPPQEGFFFGGYDVDEYYWKDLEHTKTALEGILAEEDSDSAWWWYEYRSSW